MSPWFEKVLTWVGLPVLGGIAHHMWGRYRQRLVRLQWSAEHWQIGVSSEDQGFGKVTLFYNDQPVKFLHGTRVQLRNTSTRDLSNVTVHATYLDGSRILRSLAYPLGGLTALPITPAFDTQLKLALSKGAPQPIIDYVLRNHEYGIPVLNRGGVVQLDLLVTRDDAAQPTVSLEVIHPGVRLDYREPGADAYGVPRGQAQVAGVLLGIIVSSLMILQTVDIRWAVPVVLVLGADLLRFGALVVRVLQGIGRMLS